MRVCSECELLKFHQFQEDLSFKEWYSQYFYKVLKIKLWNGGLNFQRVESDEEMGMNG